MSKPERHHVSLAWPLIVGAAVLIAGVLVYRLAPESSAAGRVASESETVLRNLPGHARRTLDQVRQRYALAKSAFKTAKVESERALVSQLQEAKERGSVPPL